MRFPFPGSTLIDWASGVAVAAAVALLLFGMQRLLIHRLARRAPHTTTSLDDWVLRVLRSTSSLFLVLVSLYAGSLTLALSEQHALLLRRMATTVVLIQAAVWGDVAVRAWRERFRGRAGPADSAVGVLSTAILDFLLRLAVWIIVALMILDNLGFNITTLVASLGIGGIAVALAVQNVLGDLFASLSIVLDKPFVVGDFIIVDDILGTVEYIGLKTTRLRSLGGEQVIFSNGDLLKARIRNHQRMQTRRAAFVIRVSHATTEEQLRAIPGIARSIITAQENVNFERAHFFALSEFSLDFEVVYWILTADYIVYMDAQQAIYLALVRQLRVLGVEFAQPLRKVQLSGSLHTSSRTD